MLVYFLAAFILYLVFRWVYTPRHLPPGPWGLPVLGYLPFLAQKPFDQLARKYGPIFGLQMGAHYAIFLNSPSIIREALNKPEFLDRPDDIAPFKLMGRNLIMQNGEKWRSSRQRASKIWTDLGRRRWEELIKTDIKLSPGPVDTFKTAMKLVLRPLVTILFGSELSWMEHLEATVLRGEALLETTAPSAFLPWLPLGRKQALLKNLVEDLDHRVRKELEFHLKENCWDVAPNFVSAYLEDVKKSAHLDIEVLCGVIQSFLGAGSTTVATALSWALLILAHFPQVQDQVRSASHEASIYTRAFIMEVLRWKTLVPLGVIRRTSADTTLAGFFIPKHTLVFSNFNACHHDKKFWGDPENFRPERFLSPDGTALLKPEYFIPFSVGPRSCPGDKLALRELAILVDGLIRQYHLRPEVGGNLDGKMGFLQSPLNPVIIFSPLS